MAGINYLIQRNVINALEEAEANILEGNDRVLHAFIDPFEELSSRQFMKRYRLTKPMTRELINILEPHIISPSRTSALCIPRKVLTALRFFASGSYQWDIATNMNHAMSQSSVSKAVHEVIEALNVPDIFNQYVHLPRNVEELRTLRDKFYRVHNFPGVMGCIDCTHIAIIAPKEGNNFPEEAYVNRKGYHSINVQLVCDPDLKIINVCARYPGSSHDSHIFHNSDAYRYISNIHDRGHRSFAFLGDSGYALRQWMLTPIQNAPPGSPEDNYNVAQKRARATIERCNGVLKLRFRCLLLHRVLNYNPTTASKIINACTVLHNMCMEHNVPPVELGDDEEDDQIQIDYGMYHNDFVEDGDRRGELLAGRRLQQIIVRNHFTNNN